MNYLLYSDYSQLSSSSSSSSDLKVKSNQQQHHEAVAIVPLCVTSSCDHSTLHALFSSSPSMLGSLIYNLKVNDLIFSIKHNCHLYLLLEQAQLQLIQTLHQSLFVSIKSVEMKTVSRLHMCAPEHRFLFIKL